jgi:oxygen-dependent protoporphyrinogen oxidase
MKNNIIVIGAGLTGLTLTYHLLRRGYNVTLVEQKKRIGGQLETHCEQGFTFESGPNTGVISYPEVAELLAQLTPHCTLETAQTHAKCRLIWKGSRFHPLPSSLRSAVSTPLFTFSDKLRILGEPWRSKGNNPDESVGALAKRRLGGQSFVDYAVDPFLSGVYAGDPDTLTARYALPKLYRLEQEYGSFVRGSIAKARLPKSDRDRLATKEVFSVRGGLGRLIDALGMSIGSKNIITGANQLCVKPLENGWEVAFTAEGEERLLQADKVISTIGAYNLPELLPFIDREQMDKLSNLTYAPVMQVSVGVKKGKPYPAFGGLVPSKERKRVLGILFPSACFEERAPKGGELYSFFIGGVRHAELIDLSDEEVEALVTESLCEMLKYPVGTRADMIRIFRHRQAIPQYGLSSGDRFHTITQVQQHFPGLIIAGNLRDGIGMSDRIKQAATIAANL